MVEGLLLAAEDLLRQRGRSAAARRRAVSSAYYAVFHRIAKLCAETLLSEPSVNSAEYERIYRALQHGTTKQAFGDKALKASASIKVIGDAFAQLRSERERADYAPPVKGLFALEACGELVSLARTACRTVDHLTRDECMLVTTLLLFKARIP